MITNMLIFERSHDYSMILKL